MKLLDSDLLGILLALATFIVPAVSGVLEKKRKERKRREAGLHQEAQPEDSQEQDVAESDDDAQKLNEEMTELFNVLMGRDIAGEETKGEEILPDSFHEPGQEMPQPQEVPQPQEMPEPMHKMVDEQVVSQTEHIGAVVEPEVQSENSLKKRIKANPKEAVVLSEILTPKFKEYN